MQWEGEKKKQKINLWGRGDYFGRVPGFGGTFITHFFPVFSRRSSPGFSVNRGANLTKE